MRAIQDNDEAGIKAAILRLSESRRVFAPLAFAVGAFVMLFNGLRLLVTNWRLTLVQILPAMWIWSQCSISRRTSGTSPTQPMTGVGGIGRPPVSLYSETLPDTTGIPSSFAA